MADHKKLGNLPPSPFPTLPIVGHLTLIKQPIHRTFAKIANKNGPIIYLKLGSTGAVIISTASGAEECLSKKNDEIFSNRPAFTAGETYRYNFTTVYWAPYGDLWCNLKPAVSTNTLALNQLVSLAEGRAEEARQLLIRMHRVVSASKEQTLDVDALMFETVNNLIMRMLVGKRYYDETEVTEEAIKFKQLASDTNKIKGLLTVADFFPALKWFGSGNEKELLDRFRAFFQGIIDERRPAMEEDDDCVASSLVDILILKQKKDPQIFTDDIITGQLYVMWFVGKSVILATIEWALSSLLNQPDLLAKAQAEINETIGHRRLLNESDLDRLPYLHCIINETFRMYPAAPLLIHRASQDCIVAGYHVPQDTILFVNLWAIHNDPESWDEPRKFKPERFEGVDWHKLGPKFMPFGIGMRGCPRGDEATKSTSLVLGLLLQCYECERNGKEEIDMEENFFGLTMLRAKPLVAKCKARQQMIGLFDV